MIEDLRTGTIPLIEQFADEATKLNLRYNVEVSKELWGKPSLEKYKQGYARRGTLIRQLQELLQDYPFRS